MSNKSKTVHMELPANEAIMLVTHLTEFLSGSQGRIQRLTNRKFDLLDIVLFAKFGFKSSVTLGFRKLKPYFTDNHWRIVKEIIEIDFKVKKMEFSNLYLDNVNKHIHHLINVENYSPYESHHVYDDLKWKQLGEKYIEMGAIQSEDELKNMITDLCEASEKR
jgi:hypothetical protein